MFAGCVRGSVPACYVRAPNLFLRRQNRPTSLKLVAVSQLTGPASLTTSRTSESQQGRETSKSAFRVRVSPAMKLRTDNKIKVSGQHPNLFQ